MKSWLTKWFRNNTQARRSSARTGRAFRPSLELFERRDLLDAGLTASLSGGVLRIQDPRAGDAIAIHRSNDQISVDGIDILANGSNTPAIDAHLVSRIELSVPGGGDVIDLNSQPMAGQQPLGLPVSLQVGQGLDHVLYGAGQSLVDAAGDAITADSTGAALFELAQGGALSRLNALTGDVTTLAGNFRSVVADGSGDVYGLDQAGHLFLGTAAASWGQTAIPIGNVTITPSAVGVSVEGDASLPLVGSVHLKGSVQNDTHYSLSASLDSITVGGVTLSNDSVTLDPSGLSAEGDANLPLLGSMHVKGSIQDATHYSFGASPTGLTLGGFGLANDVVTLNAGGLSVEGDTTLPVVGAVHLKGSIQDASHYSLSASLGNFTLAGFTLSNAGVTLSDAGVSLSGDATLPIVGAVHHLNGAIPDATNYSLTAPLPSVTVGGVTLSNDTVTLSAGGLVVEGDATLPVVGGVHLKGSIQDANHFSLAAPVQDLTVAGFGLKNNKVTVSNNGVQLDTDVTLPVVGTTHLTSALDAAAGLDLTAPVMDQISFAGFNLDNVAVHVNDQGLSLTGKTHLALVGDVGVSWGVGSDGTAALIATHDDIHLFGNMITLSHITVTLTPSAVTVKAHADVAGLAYADFVGTLGSDGSYSLLGKGGVKLGPIAVDGIDFQLGSQDIGFTVPVPSIGDVKVKGSYDPAKGNWYIEGTYPQTVVVGGIPLHDITVGVGSDHFTVGATCGIDNLLEARVTGSFFFDGRFVIQGDAKALSLGSFSVGHGTVLMTNDSQTIHDFFTQINLDPANYHSQVLLGVNADVGIPLGPTVHLQGFVDNTGNYDLEGQDKLQIGGETLSQAKFKLIKGAGFSFDGDWNFSFFTAHVGGTIDDSGHVKFHGDADSSFAGFHLGNVHAEVDLNPGAGTYLVHLTSHTNVFVATVDFDLLAQKDAQGWHAPVLKGHAQVSGALASILTGSADFTLDGNGVTFSGSLSIPNVSGSFNVQGTVRPDGTLQIGGYAGQAGAILAQDAAHILHEVGADAGKIAGVLKGLYNTSAQAVAQDLHALAVSAQDIASALKGNFNTAVLDTARMLYDLNVGASALTGAMQNAYGVAVNYWRDGSKEVYQEVTNGVVSLERQWQNGVKVVEAAWANGVNTLYSTWNTAGQKVKEYWRSGTQEFQNLYTNGALTLATTWTNGVKTLENAYDAAGKRISAYWQSGSRFIYQEYSNGVATLERQWQNGVKVVEAAWANGVNTLYYVWNTAGQKVSEYWRSGTQEFQNLYTSGARTLATTWTNGVKTLENAYDAAGKRISSYWQSGSRFIYQEYSNGVTTLERQWQGGVKVVEAAWANGVNTLYYTWNTAGQKVKEYWRSGTQEFQNLYTSGARTLATTWTNGVKTLENAYNAAGKQISSYWQSGSRFIYQEYSNGVTTLERQWQGGVKVVEAAWANGVNTLYYTWNTAGQKVSEYWRSGTQEFQNLYTNGARTLATTWTNGVKTLENAYDAAGKRISSYWQSGSRFIYQEYSNGVTTLERQWQGGVKVVEAAWANGVNTLYYTWNTAGQKVSEYWRSGTQEFQNLYTNGVRVAQNTWQNGVQVAKYVWNTAGTYLGDALSNAGSAAKNFLSSLGL